MLVRLLTQCGGVQHNSADTRRCQAKHGKPTERAHPGLRDLDKAVSLDCLRPVLIELTLWTNAAMHDEVAKQADGVSDTAHIL